jgi:hypothetical protein
VSSPNASWTHGWRLPDSTITRFIAVSNLTNRSNDCCVEYAYEDGSDGDGPAGLDLDGQNDLGPFPSIGIVRRFGSAAAES